MTVRFKSRCFLLDMWEGRNLIEVRQFIKINDLSCPAEEQLLVVSPLQPRAKLKSPQSFDPRCWVICETMTYWLQLLLAISFERSDVRFPRTLSTLPSVYRDVAPLTLAFEGGIFFLAKRTTLDACILRSLCVSMFICWLLFVKYLFPLWHINLAPSPTIVSSSCLPWEEMYLLPALMVSVPWPSCLLWGGEGLHLLPDMCVPFWPSCHLCICCWLWWCLVLGLAFCCWLCCLYHGLLTVVWSYMEMHLFLSGLIKTLVAEHFFSFYEVCSTLPLNTNYGAVLAAYFGVNKIHWSQGTLFRLAGYSRLLLATTILVNPRGQTVLTIIRSLIGGTIMIVVGFLAQPLCVCCLCSFWSCSTYIWS